MTIQSNQEFCVPYVEGDGVGPELMSYARAVADQVLKKCYGEQRRIIWKAVLCGEKAAAQYQGDWFPEETLNVIEQYKCALIGPITAPIGYGFKSLNVALRHELGLRASYTRYVSHNGNSLYVLRDNSEDLPIKLEWQTDSFDGNLLATFLKEELGVNKVPLAEKSVMALKYISESGVDMLLSSATELAKSRNIKNITIVHHANSLPISEGSVVRWALSSIKRYSQNSDDDSLPKYVDDIAIDVCSLLQFFTQHRTEQGDTIYISANYLATILNEYFTGSLGQINKVSQTNFGNDICIFEPKHGPLHSLVGSDEITPVALINAVVSLFYHLGCLEAANYLTKGLFEAEKSLKDNTISFKQFQETLALTLG